MGVKGLQTFLEKHCPSACYKVRIEDLVQEYRNEKHMLGEEEVEIVVDGQCCIRQLYQGAGLEWIGGGQMKQFLEKAKHFVDQFRNIGVRLTFYFDGPTVEEKRNTWVERRLSRLENVYEVLDIVESGRLSHEVKRENFILPPAMGQLGRVIFEDICFCEVLQSLSECDEEIAKYARDRKDKVFAILSQDSDFVIYNKGNALYLSLEKLDLENMTTLLYDHRELSRHLHLRDWELPVLATLMGNDIIDFKDIRGFHLNKMRKFPGQKIKGINYQYLVPNLAQYISNLRLRRNQLHSATIELSKQLFRTPDRADDVWASINSYNALAPRDYDRLNRRYRGHWHNVLMGARERHLVNQAPGMIYAIMSGLPFESSTSLEDYRKTDLPTFEKATRAVRERIYGILLQEKPLDPGQRCHRVPEWCMAGPDSLNQANYVNAAPPNPRHSGLLNLWNENRRDLRDERWKLFVKSVSPDLDVQSVRNLPRFLVIPTLILSFLKEFNCLQEWEMDAVLATALCMEGTTARQLESLAADPMSTRGIRIADLVMRSTFVLYLLLAACGHPVTPKETAPTLFFDGKLFQKKYNLAKTGCAADDLYPNNHSSRDNFRMAKEIINREN